MMKRRAAYAILGLIPTPVAGVFFATGNAASSDAAKPATTSPGRDESYSNPTRTKSDRGRSQSHQRIPAGAKDPALPTPPPPSFQIPDPDPIREAQLADIEGTLNIFGNQYMNKHLLYSLVELVIVRLVPEMREKSVQELLEERIGPTVEQGV